MRRIEVSREFSKKIYQDGLLAYEDPNHPCHPFVEWQREHGCDDFQLPEPFSGRFSDLGLVFIGLNPGFTADENMPTAVECKSFKDYDAFYRERFDDKNRDTGSRLLITTKSNRSRKPGKYWNEIEGFGTEHIRFDGIKRFRLGDHALITETIRYKSAESWNGYNRTQQKEVMRHERSLTRELLEHLKPMVVVAVGAKALHELAEVSSFERRPPMSIEAAVGLSFSAALSTGHSMIVCPVKHFSSTWPQHRMTHEQKASAGKRIREALDKI